MSFYGKGPRRPPAFHSNWYPSEPSGIVAVTVVLVVLPPVGWYIMVREGYRKYLWWKEDSSWRKDDFSRRKSERQARALALSKAQAEARANALMYEHFP